MVGLLSSPAGGPRELHGPRQHGRRHVSRRRNRSRRRSGVKTKQRCWYTRWGLRGPVHVRPGLNIATLAAAGTCPGPGKRHPVSSLELGAATGLGHLHLGRRWSSREQNRGLEREESRSHSGSGREKCLEVGVDLTFPKVRIRGQY